MIYLDTHVVLWLSEAKIEYLSGLALDLIRAEPLLVSPLVKLEIGYLHEIGRVAQTPDYILNYMGERVGLRICDKALGQVVTEAMALSWTRDPFDRLIVAQAQVGGNKLVTRDQVILQNYELACW